MSLDNAIDLLIRTACREETDKYTAGVAVLKAAEKIIKEDCLSWLNLAKAWFVPGRPINADYIQPQDQIRVLLESLPDPEPK